MITMVSTSMYDAIAVVLYKIGLAAIEDIFRKAELTDGIDMDGETLTDLRFADDVALLTKTPQQMESQMNTLNNISKTVGLKMHKGKTKSYKS